MKFENQSFSVPHLLSCCLVEVARRRCRLCGEMCQPVGPDKKRMSMVNTTERMAGSWKQLKGKIKESRTS